MQHSDFIPLADDTVLFVFALYPPQGNDPIYFALQMFLLRKWTIERQVYCCLLRLVNLSFTGSFKGHPHTQTHTSQRLTSSLSSGAGVLHFQSCVFQYIQIIVQTLALKQILISSVYYKSIIVFFLRRPSFNITCFSTRFHPQCVFFPHF